MVFTFSSGFLGLCVSNFPLFVHFFILRLFIFRLLPCFSFVNCVVRFLFSFLFCIMFVSICLHSVGYTRLLRVVVYVKRGEIFPCYKCSRFDFSRLNSMFVFYPSSNP